MKSFIIIQLHVKFFLILGKSCYNSCHHLSAIRVKNDRNLNYNTSCTKCQSNCHKTNTINKNKKNECSVCNSACHKSSTKKYNYGPITYYDDVLQSTGIFSKNLTTGEFTEQFLLIKKTRVENEYKNECNKCNCKNCFIDNCNSCNCQNCLPNYENKHCYKCTCKNCFPVDKLCKCERSYHFKETSYDKIIQKFRASNTTNFF
jgi:hypothetical protein